MNIMMGFVAALSSSIAFIVLIMSGQLLNLLYVSMHRQEQKSSLHVEVSDSSSESNENKENLSYYLNPDLVKQLDIKRNIYLTCDYGSNFSEDVSKKIMLYNYLLIKKIHPDAHVFLTSPIHNVDKVNSCVLNYKDN